MILVIDNYDSFTYNLVQYLGELGGRVVVYRNDAIDLAGIESLGPERILISPGPCTPNEAGICMDVVRAFGHRLPILGVCLGHQCIAQALGGRVVRARQVMHGKVSAISHTGTGVFAGLPNPLQATRYHSLVVAADDLPEALEVNAWTTTGQGGRDEIMGLAHRQWPLHGVQFHPESIRSQGGHALLRNFLEL